MNSNIVRIAQQGEYTDRQLDLIRRTVATDANSQEFDLFCEVARRTGLDPFRKQLSIIVFNKNDEKKRRIAIFAPIDGLRSIAARSLRYRPDEDAPRVTYNEELKDPQTNPLGLERAEVRVYIRDAHGEEWRPVTGVAYWDEFAPVTEEWAWGERRGERVPTGKMKLDGQWSKMGRLMLAKCAEAQALRKAFPEDLSGLYESSELDQARAAELTASERIEALHVQDRLDSAGVANSIMFTFSPAAGIEPVPLGQVADRCLEAIAGFDLRHLTWFESANTHPLREFWARAKSDALAVKQAMEARKAELLKAQEGADD